MFGLNLNIAFHLNTTITTKAKNRVTRALNIYTWNNLLVKISCSVNEKQWKSINFCPTRPQQTTHSSTVLSKHLTDPDESDLPNASPWLICLEHMSKNDMFTFLIALFNLPWELLRLTKIKYLIPHFFFLESNDRLGRNF